MPGDPYFAFLLLSPNLNGESEEEHRELRLGMLAGLCEVVKLQFPDAKDIVGIATEKWRQALQSQDVLYRDARIFTEEDRKFAEEIRKASGFLTDLRYGRTTYPDFPHPSTPPLEVPFVWEPRRMKGRGRNQLCQCGSGKKFKRCCGR
jgi:hypothetical protein